MSFADYGLPDGDNYTNFRDPVGDGPTLFCQRDGFLHVFLVECCHARSR
jgi:hypothetical protein